MQQEGLAAVSEAPMVPLLQTGCNCRPYPQRYYTYRPIELLIQYRQYTAVGLSTQLQLSTAAEHTIGHLYSVRTSCAPRTMNDRDAYEEST